MRRWLLALLLTLAWCRLAAAADPLIASDALPARLADGHTVVIDAEPADLYARAHIPGAVNLPHMDLEDAEENAASGRPVFPDRAAKMFGALGIGSATPVVVYDGGNGRAASAVWYVLTYLGHGDVRILDGGFRKWLAEGRPVTQKVSKPKTVAFKAGERKDWVLKTEDLAKGAAMVVDARSLAEFAGKDAGGAARAGHIPGAVSLPWDRVAGDLRTFADPEAMRAAFAKAGITPDREVVTYCNPGLGRSTFLMVALTLIGHDKVRTYPGSWIEWAGDPARPIER